MRLWVLANTILTYLYSVHLKPITGIKNFVCAAIVSMAIGLGAMAVDSSAASVRTVWRPMVAVAGLIWHREMVMDVRGPRLYSFLAILRRRYGNASCLCMYVRASCMHAD